MAIVAASSSTWPVLPRSRDASLLEVAERSATSSELDDLLKQALESVEVARLRARRADEEAARCREAVRCLRSEGATRVVMRQRPQLASDGNELCVRPCGPSQFEILENLALRSPQHRRRSIGCVRETSPERSESTPVGGRTQQEPRLVSVDSFFDAEASDDEVYSFLRNELLAAADGKAVCALVYGAAGSGRTHSLAALATRAAKDLGAMAARLAEGDAEEAEVAMQILEADGEDFWDLQANATVDAHGDASAEGGGTTCVPEAGASTPVLPGFGLLPLVGGGASPNLPEDLGDQVATALATAEAARGIAGAPSATRRNASSEAASHLIVTLRVTIRERASGAIRREGTLSLVDLAPCGSNEPSSRRSLAALSGVLQARERRSPNIDYQGTALTRLLAGPLGNTPQSSVVLFFALAPFGHVYDTLRTAQFAQHVASLRQQNIAPRIASARKLLTQSEHQLHQAQGGKSAGGRSPIGEELRLRHELVRLRASVQSCREEVQLEHGRLREKDSLLEQALAEERALKIAEERNQRLMNSFAAFHGRLLELEAATDISSGPPAGVLAALSERVCAASLDSPVDSPISKASDVLASTSASTSTALAATAAFAAEPARIAPANARGTALSGASSAAAPSAKVSQGSSVQTSAPGLAQSGSNRSLQQLRPVLREAKQPETKPQQQQQNVRGTTRGRPLGTAATATMTAAAAASAAAASALAAASANGRGGDRGSRNARGAAVAASSPTSRAGSRQAPATRRPGSSASRPAAPSYSPRSRGTTLGRSPGAADRPMGSPGADRRVTRPGFNFPGGSSGANSATAPAGGRRLGGPGASSPVASGAASRTARAAAPSSIGARSCSPGLASGGPLSAGGRLALRTSATAEEGRARGAPSPSARTIAAAAGRTSSRSSLAAAAAAATAAADVGASASFGSTMLVPTPLRARGGSGSDLRLATCPECEPARGSMQGQPPPTPRGTGTAALGGRSASELAAAAATAALEGAAAAAAAAARDFADSSQSSSLNDSSVSSSLSPWLHDARASAGDAQVDGTEAPGSAAAASAIASASGAATAGAEQRRTSAPPQRLGLRLDLSGVFRAAAGGPEARRAGPDPEPPNSSEPPAAFAVACDDLAASASAANDPFVVDRALPEAPPFTARFGSDALSPRGMPPLTARGAPERHRPAVSSAVAAADDASGRDGGGHAAGSRSRSQSSDDTSDSSASASSSSTFGSRPRQLPTQQPPRQTAAWALPTLALPARPAMGTAGPRQATAPAADAAYVDPASALPHPPDTPSEPPMTARFALPEDMPQQQQQQQLQRLPPRQAPADAGSRVLNPAIATTPVGNAASREVTVAATAESEPAAQPLARPKSGFLVPSPLSPRNRGDPPAPVVGRFGPIAAAAAAVSAAVPRIKLRM
eukprot:TRINITY_DN3999_c0_g1_i1.p1 TRINITY_DN3999_c0_g1~~TRINITY_DN3999_c0_g1_i1.p1  ORF type:complete len:1409 (+),score=300.13 TRINITY_DN3999_c0_g1_i1:361-4587(+)